MKGNIIIILCVFCLSCKSQNNNISFGIQYKPIIPSAYFNSSDLENQVFEYKFELKPNYSNSFGMFIRKRITKIFSTEFGINYTTRNFMLEIQNANLNLKDKTYFALRSYELPLQLLTYIQISNFWYLNTAFGLSNNVLASDVFSEGEKNKYYLQNTYRRNGGYKALLANIGVEYRTDKIGDYYLGISLHRPWIPIAKTYPIFKNNNTNNDPVLNNSKIDIPGNYLTFDLRYIFSE